MDDDMTRPLESRVSCPLNIHSYMVARWWGAKTSFRDVLAPATCTVKCSVLQSKWHKLAQDKENWKDLISEIGEESKKSKAKKKRKQQWNPLASCGAGCAGK